MLTNFLSLFIHFVCLFVHSVCLFVPYHFSLKLAPVCVIYNPEGESIGSVEIEAAVSERENVKETGWVHTKYYTLLPRVGN